MSDEATKSMLGVYTGAGFVPAHEWKLAWEEVQRLEADNARLRALIKENETHCCGECGWCRADVSPYRPDDRHKADCPAFTPEGIVR